MGEELQTLPSLQCLLKKTKEILSHSQKLFESGLIETEAEQIMMDLVFKLTGQTFSRIEFYTKDSAILEPIASQGLLSAIQVAAQKRVSGMPLSYVLGAQKFLNHPYEVNSAVLIPKAETEILLEAVIQSFKTEGFIPQIGIEIGLGSGNISIELLCQYPKLRMVASEVCLKAKDCALKNADQILGPLSKSRLTILSPEHRSQIWEPFESPEPELQKADFLITNPPYLSPTDAIDPEVLEHEPHLALFPPNDDAFFFYRRIFEKASVFLKPNAWIFAEIPHERSDQILELFRQTISLPLWKANILPDLTGRPRVLVAKSQKSC